MKLSKAEIKMLKLAEHFEGEGCGVHHSGSGARAAMLRRMQAKGLLSFAGFGPDADEGWGENGQEYPIWTLAPLGYDHLAEINKGSANVS